MKLDSSRRDKKARGERIWANGMLRGFQLRDRGSIPRLRMRADRQSGERPQYVKGESKKGAMKEA